MLVINLETKIAQELPSKIAQTLIKAKTHEEVKADDKRILKGDALVNKIKEIRFPKAKAVKEINIKH